MLKRQHNFNFLNLRPRFRHAESYIVTFLTFVSVKPVYFPEEPVHVTSTVELSMQIAVTLWGLVGTENKEEHG